MQGRVLCGIPELAGFERPENNEEPWPILCAFMRPTWGDPLREAFKDRGVKGCLDWGHLLWGGMSLFEYVPVTARRTGCGISLPILSAVKGFWDASSFTVPAHHEDRKGEAPLELSLSTTSPRYQFAILRWRYAGTPRRYGHDTSYGWEVVS